MKRSAVVACAVVLDVLIGDPKGLPHPVRVMGDAIAAGEPFVRSKCGSSPRDEVIAGALLSAGIIAGAVLCGRAIEGCGPLAEMLAAASTLAFRDLCDEASSVAAALDAADLAQARERVARIVGRDTHDLATSEIARATIETLAESTCDGVVAPLMALTLGGVPAAFAYKAVNTLDSMIGHPEPPYAYFGRCAARVDDVANYIPARVSALCIAGAAQLLYGRGSESLRCWRAEGDRHRSPNAGQSEAAMAGALGVRLGGANRYAGTLVHGPIFGDIYDRADAGDVHRAIVLTRVASALAFTGALLVSSARDALA